MIQAEHITKTFHGFKALDDMSLHVPKGTIYGLVGPNGAGKSTLIRHLTGIYRPDSGSILIDGLPVYDNPEAKIKFTYIPDDMFYFFQANTLEMKQFYQGIYKKFDSGLFERLQEFFPNIDTKRAIRRLSKGMQKQVAFWLSICAMPELMILDINLPDGDGFTLFRTLNSMADIPALFLSARDADADRLFGLGLGADDYLTKPFLTQELLLRIQRILQRCYRGELWRTAAKTLQLGQRTVYLADALVRLPDGTAQPLTATERALLQKLAENRGHIVTYDAVCEAVWGADYYGYENSLNVHIRHLREKLEPNPSKPQYLLTVRGIGYKLAEENAQ